MMPFNSLNTSNKLELIFKLAYHIKRTSIFLYCIMFHNFLDSFRNLDLTILFPAYYISI